MPNPSVTVESSSSDLLNSLAPPPFITRANIVPRGHRKTPWVVAGVSATLAVASMIAAGVMYGMLAAATAPSGPVSHADAVDNACVQVLHNGGLPDDCSRMYHVMPMSMP